MQDGIEICEGTKRSFLTLGPGYTRCDNQSHVLVVEDKTKQYMSLCPSCRSVFTERNPEGYKYIKFDSIDNLAQVLSNSKLPNHKTRDVDHLKIELL